jgi:hypothetical protein
MTGFTHVGGGGETTTAAVLSTSGDDAIVDWVFLELRSAVDSAVVIKTKAALVQRDGDIVGTDGALPVAFTGTEPGNYFLSVRHRNHLGIMTSTAVALSGTASTLDFTNGSTPTYGQHAQKVLPDTKRGLWAGNANLDKKVVASGSTTDANAVSIRVLTHPGNTAFSPTYPAMGYYVEDTNMNGTALWIGTNNDVAILLANVLSHPGNTTSSSYYPILQQLP